MEVDIVVGGDGIGKKEKVWGGGKERKKKGKGQLLSSRRGKSILVHNHFHRLCIDTIFALETRKTLNASAGK